MKRIYAIFAVLALLTGATAAVCQAKVTTCEVNLSWDAPTSSTDAVAGYNIYRAPSGSMAYALLNSTVNAPTTYTDSTVTAGAASSYYIESVDSQGNQSVPSNVASVTLPAMPPAMAKPTATINP